MCSKIPSHKALLAFIVSVTAQLGPWDDGQINTTLCTWQQPRAALVRDTIYLDGGWIEWAAGFKDQLAPPEGDGNPQGLIFTYNLSTPFTPDTNVTGILLEKPISKAIGGTGNANGAAPLFVDGAMLANDAQFYLYGGTVFKNDQVYDTPDADWLLGYAAHQFGPNAPSWNPGFDSRSLPEDVTRYVTYGGAVNAPSENMAWYFPGQTSPKEGEIYYLPTNDSVKASEVSDRLISLQWDRDDQTVHTWRNETIPDYIKGRANPEVVWVPVGEKGMLIVLGGVVYPDWAGTLDGQSSNEKQSEKQSPEFMQTIDIYDVAGKKWYKQRTEGGPGTRTRGCAVVVPASDFSSYNIYYYGGYDGIHRTEEFSDDVWVLSLPSFTWTKLNEGKSLHARAGHKCFLPYPDQMMVIGGYTPQAGSSRSCLDVGPIVMLNTSSGEWQDSYDPAKHDDYAVPDKVQSVIGGNGAGGATATAPVPSGWATSGLEKVFATSYDMDKINTFYPYASEATSTGGPDDGGSSDEDSDGGSGLPSWVAPVLGVVLGLIVVTTAIVVFCLWRKRKIFKNRGYSDYGTEDTRSRILAWMMGQREPAEKAPTVTTSEDTPMSPEMMEQRGFSSTTPSTFPIPPPSHLHEAGDTGIHELDDTSPPNELPDSPLSHAEIISRHSRVGKKKKERSLSNPSYSSVSMAGGALDDYTTLSRSSGARGSNVAVNTPPPRASPSPCATPEPGATFEGRVVSGVSERELGHLRNISEVTDSGDGRSGTMRADDDGGRPGPDRRTSEQSQSMASPISPPSAGAHESEDYVTAQDLVSPLRRSIFRESQEDMGQT